MSSDVNTTVEFVVSRGDTQGKIFSIEQGTALIGRWDPDAGAFPEIDLELHDPEAKVSRRHATLELEGAQLTVEDVGSLNGTFVNRGARLEPGNKVQLSHGDELVIGKTFLTVKFNPPPIDA